MDKISQFTRYPGALSVEFQWGQPQQLLFPQCRYKELFCPWRFKRGGHSAGSSICWQGEGETHLFVCCGTSNAVVLTKRIKVSLSGLQLRGLGGRMWALEYSSDLLSPWTRKEVSVIGGEIEETSHWTRELARELGHKGLKFPRCVLPVIQWGLGTCINAWWWDIHWKLLLGLQRQESSWHVTQGVGSRVRVGNRQPCFWFVTLNCVWQEKNHTNRSVK